jgi:hypothetical protein
MTRLWPRGDPIEVLPGAGGAPQSFRWHGGWHQVAAIANRWRVQTNWWQPAEEVDRAYFKLTTADGLLCVLYTDLRDGAWYCARLYD